MKKIITPLVLLLGCMMVSCKAKIVQGLHFTFLPASETGVDFKNTITENDSVNMFVNEYAYMGGGVGIGDFNNDGLPDIFFAGNQVSSQLYINHGSMHFENITQKAGVATAAWCTGVSVVDINNDGWADIYVSVSGKATGIKRKNLLFINQHDLTFKEEAAEYGLADTSYSTQAVFFDYDKDGRLDMYLLNHTLNDPLPNDLRDNKTDSNAIAGDKLYRNEGVPAGMTHPVFKDVSKQAGIVEDGDGLGVVVDDFNNDGYPDVYVANDYIRNDILWINNKNGTFSNCIATAIKHQSYSSMGTDAADINNDCLPDIITLDMQPETNERKKMMYSFLNEQRHQVEMDKGYQPEYIHNMLQLNNGTRPTNNHEEPFFSEIGEMAGLAETDWSWSVLIADLDNDGWKDVHITNGLGRDPTNMDFLEYRHNTVVQSGVPESDVTQRQKLLQHLTSLGNLALRNYLFKNNGDLTFEDISEIAGITQKSISNGAAYADLDNDGNLDIVTNNIDGPAFIMHNDAGRQNQPGSGNNYLTIKLTGDSLNKDGIGAVVDSYSKGLTQMVRQYPVKGYLSSVDNRLHTGFGTNDIDSLKITWPDGKMQVIQHPAPDKILQVNYADAASTYIPPAPSANTFFDDVTQQLKTGFQHKESFFFDYQFQPMLLQKYSQEGPFMSVGDVNGDHLEDFFIGGAFKQPGRLFLQNASGSFTGKGVVTGAKYEEDMQSVLFDADGDSDLDLLVVGGSTEFDDNSPFYRPRLYLNDGKGNFHLDSTAFSPAVLTPAKCVAVADIDGDGDDDIFIGGNVSLGYYPRPPRSYILRNDHGKFTDVTETVCPALMNPGMINAAVWVDINNDKKPDLVIAGDWMPVSVYKNNGSTLTDITAESGLAELPGFWRSLAITDVDHDGDLDIIAGNLGLNNPFHINAQQPAQLIAKDFDNSGIPDPLFCYYNKGSDGKYALSVSVSRTDWARQMPSLKKRFEDNSSYAKATMNELVTKDMMDGALVLNCKEVRSGYFENNGKGKFIFHPFPVAAQVAPVNAIATADVNEDGSADIILAGNEYQWGINPGRFDASYGLLLTGDGKGNFKAMAPRESGLIIDGDVKDLKIINADDRQILLCSINDDKLKAFVIKKK